MEFYGTSHTQNYQINSVILIQTLNDQSSYLQLDGGVDYEFFDWFVAGFESTSWQNFPTKYKIMCIYIHVDFDQM
jgi:hypothetical protein